MPLACRKGYHSFAPGNVFLRQRTLGAQILGDEQRIGMVVEGGNPGVGRRGRQDESTGAGEAVQGLGPAIADLVDLEPRTAQTNDSVPLGQGGVVWNEDGEGDEDGATTPSPQEATR